MKLNTASVTCALVTLLGAACKDDGGGSLGSFDGPKILFVTQVPIGAYANVATSFDNHEPTMAGTPRGGGLMLRSADGTLRNLTTEAGFGDVGQQGTNAIAVREPTVHWDGDKALFSMVIGAPTMKYEQNPYNWQIYEVSGLSSDGPIAIRKINNQPQGYNNVSPFYASDDRILFTSDRPRDGAAHHYPQRDEYESNNTVVGIYALAEDTGDLELLEHTPSGLFNPSVDSFGRIIFTRWDHLQRDQQGDDPAKVAEYKPFTWASEDADAATTTTTAGSEMFPEARSKNDPTYDPTYAEHAFNQFFPWMIGQDGTGEETVNHVGRHELGGSYTEGNFVADPALTYVVDESLRANKNFLQGSAGLFQIHEDPLTPGRYYTTFSAEFSTCTSGYLMRFDGGPEVNPMDMQLQLVTPAFDTSGKPVGGVGMFRDPMPLSNGKLIAAQTDADDLIKNNGSDSAPDWSYSFRLREMDANGSMYSAGAFLTAGIAADLTWWSPDVSVHWAGNLWELNPVEVRKRDRPQVKSPTLEQPEQTIFDGLGLSADRLRDWLRTNELALIVSRNVTQRDRADRAQPYNLRVPGGAVSDTGNGMVYDVTHLQLFQGDQLRGYGDPSSPSPGRRVLARPMHAPNTSPAADGIDGAVRIFADGSVAAFVPARRAMAWQLYGNGKGIVRERNWVSFQAGEIRVCAACHGINRTTQTGATVPMNSPMALQQLLTDWIAAHPN